MTKELSPLQERELYYALMRSFKEATKLGVRPSYFLDVVWELPPVQAAKELMANPRYEEHLARLWQLGRLDLAIESIVLDERFRELFSDMDRFEAESRLCKFQS